MADNETPEQPTETPEAVDPAPPPAPRLRDHVFSFRSVIAVGVATLLIGGAGGAALVAVTSDDHDDQSRISRIGDRPDGPGRGFAPPNAPGGGAQQDVQPNSGSNG